MIRVVSLLLVLTLGLSAEQANKAARPKLPKAVTPKPAVQGPELVQRLAAMTPEERQKALATLPPARRANIELRLKAFQALPPAQQKNMQERAAKLAAMSPDRQAEVRASLREFNQLPQERKIAVRKEVRRTTGMADDSREAYMNSEGFKNRFPAAERKLINDLREVAPDEPEPGGRGK